MPGPEAYNRRYPESMKPTMASRNELVIKANEIVLFEGLRLANVARQEKDAKMFDILREFFTQPFGGRDGPK